MKYPLILASASPRRRDLLTQAGYEFTVRAADLDETPLEHEAAAAYVQRLATEKAQAVVELVRGEGLETFVVLAADTCVVSEGRLLGKPVDAADAVRMLRTLMGRTHAVMTGVAGICVEEGKVSRMEADVEITQVTFDVVSEAEIARYVASGEPLDKAGAYAIQGYAARWIPRIEGDYFNVVGLPVARTVRLLDDVQRSDSLDK